MRLGLGLGLDASPRLVFDADASFFFSRAGITNSTQRNAVNALVSSLKSAGIWAKLFAIYPIVGGSASSHSFNLKSSSYTISWQGTLTHNASGVKGDGVSGYGDPVFVPSTAGVLQNSASISVYINSADTTGGAQCAVDVAGNNTFLFFQNLVSNTYWDAFGDTTGRISGGNSGNVTGFFSANRTASNATAVYRNGVSYLSGTGASQGLQSARSPFILARNDAGGASNLSDARLAFLSIGLGLSSVEVSQFNSSIQAFESALSRS